MTLVIATKNLHKIREFREILEEMLPKGKSIEILSLKSFPSYAPPEETGATFEENAILKAEHAAKALQQVVLADDSGLVVPALGGSPGVFSRRYAGDSATDAENRKKLLIEMHGLKDLDRSAFFACSLALAAPEGLKKCVFATVEGAILEEERGNRGFGYDSLFLKYDYNETFGELDEGVKNRISHRHKALQKLLPSLEMLL